MDKSSSANGVDNLGFEKDKEDFGQENVKKYG